jgi:U3 small nucleolar RNA-associated protein 24
MKNLTPNYVLIDTNFIYFAIKNKINLNSSLLNCLNSSVIPCVSECVLMELEKLGPKFKLALKYLKNRNIIKINCFHPQNIIYADDCIYNTVNLFRYFIVATCDINLKKRIKKLSNSKLITIRKNKFTLI